MGATPDVTGIPSPTPERDRLGAAPFASAGDDTVARRFVRLRVAAGILGALLIFAGIRLLHDLDSFTLWPGMPTLRLGIVFPNPQWVLLGTACVLAGGLLCAFCLPAVPAWAASGAGATSARARAWFLRPAVAGGVTAAIAALGLYLYVVVQAGTHQSDVAVLACLILAAGLATLAVHSLFPGAREEGRRGLPRLSWHDVVAIALIMAAFIALMLHDVRYWLYSFIGDEWAFYNAAAAIAQGNAQDLLSQAGVYGIHPWANSAYQGLVMRLFGINVVGWRLSGILSVALPVIPLYWLGLALGGRAVAVAATVLYAGCHLLWAFAHIGYNSNDPLLVMVPAATLLYAGLRSDRHAYLFAAGACAGAAWYTLFSGRLMIGIAGLVILTEWRGGWKAVARRLALLLAGFALVVLPLAIDNGTDTIRQMFPLISLSQARTQGPVSSLLGQNTVRGLYSFLYATEYSHYVVGEVFDAISASALCAGVALAVRRLHDPGWRLVLIWFFVGLMLTTPLYYVPQIADTRLQIVVPPAALLAAYGLASIARALASYAARPARRAVAATCLALALGGAFLLNVDRFYNVMPKHEQPELIAMTVGALQQSPGDTVLLAGNASNNNLCQVLYGYGIEPAAVLRFQFGQVAPQCMPPAPAPGGTIAPRGDVTVLMSGADFLQVRACSIRPYVAIEAPSHSQALWEARIRVEPGPPATYLSRVAAAVVAACPVIRAISLE